jgi:hypothetical protein
MAKRREEGKGKREERLESKKERVRGRERVVRGERRGEERRGEERRGEERRGEERRGEERRGENEERLEGEVGPSSPCYGGLLTLLLLGNWEESSLKVRSLGHCLCDY